MVAGSDGEGRREMGGGARKREVNGDTGSCSSCSKAAHTRDAGRGDLVRDRGDLPYGRAKGGRAATESDSNTESIGRCGLPGCSSSMRACVLKRVGMVGAVSLRTREEGVGGTGAKLAGCCWIRGVREERENPLDTELPRGLSCAGGESEEEEADIQQLEVSSSLKMEMRRRPCLAHKVVPLLLPGTCRLPPTAART